MNEKENLLSKLNIKDYRNNLELILESKKFDEEAKSLLLNIFYKIDNFYKDYQSVKNNVENKNKFLEQYITIIRDCCSEIKILSPQLCENNNMKYIVDKDNGKIQCFPNETILLLAIFELAENNLSNPNIEFLNKCYIDMINKGKTINNTEPIRDFNGWSWNVEINENINKEYNLIYQNLIILFGYEFVNENMNSSNIMCVLKENASNQPWKDKSEELFNCLGKIAIELYNNKSAKSHVECVEYKKYLQSRDQILGNRKEFIDYTTKVNANLIKEIEQIDFILNDFSMIKEEFNNSVLQNDKQFFCISDVVDKYENKRQFYMKQIEENNKLLNPKEYLSIQGESKKNLAMYKQVVEDKNIINLKNDIIEFQKIFLECLGIKIANKENRKELLQLAIYLRYYSNIPFDNLKQITLNDSISALYDKVTRSLIYAMINEKIIEVGISNKEFCYKIINYIFKTKIMKLDSLVIKLNYYTNNELEVEYYDGDVLEHQENFKLPIDEIVSNKKSRKIKLFKTI